MLVIIRRYEDLDEKKLMEVYAGSNGENAEEFWPGEDRACAVQKVEQGFLDFLRTEFFTGPCPAYWIWEEEGRWVSALRTNRLEPGFYYLEALETRPDSRRQGCAARLLGEVIRALKEQGPFRLCDCVHKENLASLQTHAACGFRIVSETGEDHLRGRTDPWEYSLAYTYEG